MATSDDQNDRRSIFAHEVVQTSAMDCGPAALKSLLEGFGIRAHYGRLREACHTTVDGSSIDTLEELAVKLGLDASQMMLPVEHVLLPEADALPALVVTRQASGLTHFVVAWRVVGPWVQIMDPGRGRRWMRKADFVRDLYVHEMPIPEEDFGLWTREAGFLDPLRKRLRKLGAANVNQRIAKAAAEKDWQPLCRLDACARATERLLQGKVVGSNRAARVFDCLLAEAEQGHGTELLPDALWTGRPGAPDESGQPMVLGRGALVLRVASLPADNAEATETARQALPPELAVVLDDNQPGPARKLIEFLRADGLLRFLPIVAGLVLAGVGTVVESLLFRSAIDIGQRLAIFEQRLAAAAGLLVLLVGLFFIEWPLARALWSVGSRLEMHLRQAFLRKLPLLGDRYFQSRPISDMAERAHLLHWLRLLPGQGGQLVRTICEMLTTTAGVIWLYPSGAPLVLTLVAVMLILPIACQPALVERDLRMRGHAGGLVRFYLDALLGLSAIRAHTAEPALRSEHGGRLREWARAARDATRLTVSIETAQGLLGFGLAALLVFRYLQSNAGSGWAILIVYWFFMLPGLGQEIAFLIQQYPQHRNVTLRLLEPLGAPEGRAESDQAPVPLATSAGVAVELRDVRVKAAGNEILAVDALDLAGGEHVAIVGASGAGKSSLVGLLLGWYRPDIGHIHVDGRDLSGRWLDELRRQTLWVDPAVQLWNRSLLENLRFGSDGEHRPVGDAVEAAELDEVLARLPMGLQTPLGAGGALLSGGEGQRVRLGRAICRGSARLVIFDEPFCGLERSRREALLTAARRRWSQATFLCITHDIAHSLDFPRVLVVDHGRIIEDGQPQRLSNQPGTRYARLLAAEARARARMDGPEWRHLRLDHGQLIERSRGEGA
jgi:ABC-type bacteriocin/lantibiotic exporter with double-glycine peptidase domain